jgi:NADP-dependent aldehyde dehydrogenase
MGSVNPVVILPAAMKSKGSDIAAKIYGSFTNSAGQMCTCPGLILALSGADFEALAASLAALAKAGAAQPMLTPKVRDSWRSSIRDSIAAGAVPLAGPSNDSEPAERPVLLRVSSAGFRASPRLREECFGPSTLLVECTNVDDLAACVLSVGGSLTATLWAEESDPASQLLPALERIAGRVVLNGVPTGVEVCDAMVHSGPFPACNRPESTAVGAFAIRRWCRPVAYQALHDSLLPAELKSSNPLAIRRIVDGKWSC